MPKVSVLIPIYKIKPSDNEEKSFIQCLKVLEKHPISIICPHSLNISFYESVSQKFNKEISIIRLNDKYFSGIEGYNMLMLSLEFYRRFKDSEYVLIYQLDAYVFRDELEYWCDQKYDYIGAPWIEQSKNFRIKGVGNGGFSLRKTDTYIKILTEKKKVFSIKQLWQNIYKPALNNKGRYFKLTVFFRVLFYYLSDKNDIRNQYKLINEDGFWSNNTLIFYPEFKVAEINEAIKFSFEAYPTKLYAMNNFTLPFGCHAWEKYDYTSFWKNIIKEEVKG